MYVGKLIERLGRKAKGANAVKDSNASQLRV